jgi:hypothetical protein
LPLDGQIGDLLKPIQGDQVNPLELLENPAKGGNMRIAAIGLAHNATVVTCNYRDFSLVPGLSIVDWSK